MTDGYRQKKAFVNTGFILLNVMYFLYLEITGSSEDTRLMVANGAMYAPFVLERGECYRLATSIFMHFGMNHIMNNMLVLFILGDNLERALGHIKYFFFYLICGIGSNIISMMANRKDYDAVVSAGASGAIFGVIGGLFYAVLLNRGRLENLSTRQLGVVIVSSLYFGFSSTGVDNVAHIAGLLLGIVMGIILYRKPKMLL